VAVPASTLIETNLIHLQERLAMKHKLGMRAGSDPRQPSIGNPLSDVSQRSRAWRNSARGKRTVRFHKIDKSLLALPEPRRTFWASPAGR
jgi:hypothetical protein